MERINFIKSSYLIRVWDEGSVYYQIDDNGNIYGYQQSHCELCDNIDIETTFDKLSYYAQNEIIEEINNINNKNSK